MPELPEVDTMAKKLREANVAGQEVFEIYQEHVGDHYLSEEEKLNLLRAGKIRDVWRRGKFLLIGLEQGYLVCHNAMSGYWDVDQQPWTFDYVEGKREATDRDVRARFRLADGRTCRFHDARKFGRLRFYSCSPTSWVGLPYVRELGPDAILTERSISTVPWDLEDFTAKIKRRPHRSIKEILLDQQVVAGIGNIYASEALFHAEFDPRISGDYLRPTAIEKIFYSCQYVLQAAIVRELSYDKLSVYRRKNCPHCGGTIQRVELGGRNTYFCPNCQKP